MGVGLSFLIASLVIGSMWTPPGEWLLSSYIVTGMDNVPIFIKADNKFPFQHLNKDCS
jgi:hypothetical protein